MENSEYSVDEIKHNRNKNFHINILNCRRKNLTTKQKQKSSRCIRKLMLGYKTPKYDVKIIYKAQEITYQNSHLQN